MHLPHKSQNLKKYVLIKKKKDSFRHTMPYYFVKTTFWYECLISNIHNFNSLSV